LLRTAVLLVDDQAVVRSGLRTILETDEAIEVVGEANDGREAVTLTQALDPDVVMTDIRMPVLLCPAPGADREVVASR
jgi:YesN/AraC family two-component response regulator